MTPESFGRYRVESLIARGGMAAVYRAHDPLIGRTVAVKVLSRELAADPSFLARFEREAQTIAALEHPAIVSIYDFGDQDGQPYLVMRYMEGGSLRELIARGPLSLEHTLAILERVSAALQHAHDHGVIHRDLKPPNVFFDSEGNAYLGDFGIVRLGKEATALTQSGAVIGSPAYMSPEQVRAGVQIDNRSDIYSLGVVLFEMLSGEQPYQEETPAKVMMQHILEPIPRITAVAPGLGPDCDTIVRRAMAKLPEDRYQTPQELLTDLRAVATGSELTGIAPTLTSAEPFAEPTTLVDEASAGEGTTGGAAAQFGTEAQTAEPPPHRPSRRWLLAGAGGMLLVAAAAGLYSLFSDRGAATEPTPPPSTATPAPSATPLATPSPEPTVAPTLAAEFYGLRFCDRPCDSPSAVEVDTVPDGAVVIYVSWSYQGMQTGTAYTRSWSVEGEQWVHYECEWQGEAEGTIDVTLREPGGLRSGPWMVSLQIADQRPVESTVIVEGTNTFWDPPGFRPCPDTP